MKKAIFILTAPIILASCGGTPTSSEISSLSESSESSASSFSSESSGQVESYTEKQIGVRYWQSQNNVTAKIRFYNEGHIPYISIKDFVSYLYRGRTFPEGRDQFEVKKEGSVYEITVAGGHKGYFDIAKNEFSTSNLLLFKSTSLNELGVKGTVSYDGLPWIKIEDVSHDKEAKPFSIRFDDYHFSIHGDDENVYVPIAFASDLFSNENILVGAYNNEDLYVYNYTENEYFGSFGGAYYNPILAKPIESDLAQFLYNETCLNYDLFCGRPGRSSLERYYDLSNGLDNALSSRELGRTIKSYLSSTSKAEYLAGTVLLGYLLEDGGHSSYNAQSVYFMENDQLKTADWLTDEIKRTSNELINNETGKGYEEFTNMASAFNHHSDVYESRQSALGKLPGALKGDQTYTKVGDLAFIHIDGFMNEVYLKNEWAKYYSHETDVIPYGENTGGAVSATYNGLKKAKEDASIKYVVIDLTANTGGSTDEMFYMISLLTKGHTFYDHSRITDQMVSINYKIDRNLDRVFDENDETFDLLGNKKLAVLTSRNGFSCGGISPVYLHEDGVYVLGEETGGGSCSIYIQHDAYGISRRVSSPMQCHTKNGVDTDTARKTVCDTPLTITASEQEGRTCYDYTSFYDAANLKSLIDQHYSQEK